MKTKFNKTPGSRFVAAIGLLLACAGAAIAQMGSMMHMIDGVTGPSFTLSAKDGYISTADGNSVYFWGYGNGSGAAQYVGPTLIVNQGDVVTVTLNNGLLVPTSIVFPGQSNVTSSGGVGGRLTKEAAPAGTVTYSFTAVEPGTYTYHSGTRPDLQIEMGLVGALIVRPANPMQAYAHPDSAYDQEYLFLLTEMDETIHDAVEAQVQAHTTGTFNPVVDTTKWFPVYWFINGRTGPDTMLPANVSWLPAQPYDAMPVFRAGERVLMRVIGGGRDAHPFHHHGNHAQVIARDGRFLSTAGQTGGQVGANLAQSVFTIQSIPGGTVDAIFSWTGEKLGWDAYGHQSDVDNPPLGWATGGNKSPRDIDWNGNGAYDTTPLEPFEFAGDHGKPFPVKLPVSQDVTFGQMYSGSPFLGAQGILPPGEGGFNPGGFMYMWHSHSEKEIINNNIFPGGLLTMALVEAWPALMVTPDPLANPAVGVAYTQTLTAAGFTAAATWSLGAGALPEGITLSPTGVLSGTTLETGTYNFTVKVTENMSSGAKALTLVIP